MVLEDGKHLFLKCNKQPKCSHDVEHYNPLPERILLPTLRAILKHANHSSICGIKKYNNLLLILLFRSRKRRYN